MDSNKQLFNFNNQTITVFEEDKQNPYFIGSQIGKILEYVRSNDAISVHVETDEKITFSDYKKKYPNVNAKLLDNSILINESGLYSLIFNSKMEKAKEFRKYVTSVVLPSIRRTGQFVLNKKLEANQIMILDESQLQKKTVDFIRNKIPIATFTATLGELQDSDSKRINSKLLGYQKGSPDLLIFNLK